MPWFVIAEMVLCLLGTSEGPPLCLQRHGVIIDWENSDLELTSIAHCP